MNEEQFSEKWAELGIKDLVGREEELINDLWQSNKQFNTQALADIEHITAFFKIFHCQRCGQCCQKQVTEGIILMPGEAQKIATFLKLSVKEFKKKYTFTTDRGRFLNFPCPFFDKDSLSCSIFTVLPKVCQLWPINTPTNTLVINTFCPAGREVAIKILQEQARFTKELSEKK